MPLVYAGVTNGRERAWLCHASDPPQVQAVAPNAIADAAKSTEVLVALSCENRGRVDDLVSKTVAAGGKTYSKPQDYGFMYGHGFQDLDGHVWEVFYMDASAAKQS
jgi:predicted lactoylglutathione lyase